MTTIGRIGPKNDPLHGNGAGVEEPPLIGHRILAKHHQYTDIGVAQFSKIGLTVLHPSGSWKDSKQSR